jgi:predicted phosphodiesterase
MNNLGKRVLFISDIHGNLGWEKIAENGLKNSYYICFVGDYIDSFYIKAGEQLYNLNKLCNFIRKNKEYTTALLGNHDYASLYSLSGISGYQHFHAHEYKKIFEDNLDLFQIAWGYTNPETKKYTLATHAGLTNKYYKKFVAPNIKEGENIHDVLNRYQDDEKFIWSVGSARGGRGIPGPLWADYTEVLDDPYIGINQVFGHTPQITPRLDHFGDDFIACIDDYGNRKVVSMLITL